MLLDGISVQGSYHEINQDSFAACPLEDGFVAALSDGLGSKTKSHFGSQALCRSAVEIAMQMKGELQTIDSRCYIAKVHSLWKEQITEYLITDCYATMLIFVTYADRAFAARLGDGFIGIYADNQVKVLFDRKEDYFANETDCLADEIATDKMEIVDFNFETLHGGVICSDGIGIGSMLEEELAGFTREFVEGYCDMKQDEITHDIGTWLKDWPGSDDKTLAYFILERDKEYGATI